MTPGNPQPLINQVRQVFAMMWGCPACDADAQSPCTGLGERFRGTELTFIHYSRLSLSECATSQWMDLKLLGCGQLT